METRTLTGVLSAALLAGLVAGAFTAGFHLLFTEPVIDRAVEIEEERSQAKGAHPEEPVVSRRGQKIGLVLGLLLYGATWGLLFGVLFHLTRNWRPSLWGNTKWGVLLAAVAGWSVGLFPFTKYPAQPPGVGDPGTIGYRQALYLGLIGLSIAGVLLASLIYRALRGRSAAWPITLALYAGYLALVYLAMPASPDSVTMPSRIVLTFRTFSAVGLVLFWGVLGAAFAWLFRGRATSMTRS